MDPVLVAAGKVTAAYPKGEADLYVTVGTLAEVDASTHFGVSNCVFVTVFGVIFSHSDFAIIVCEDSCDSAAEVWVVIRDFASSCDLVEAPEKAFGEFASNAQGDSANLGSEGIVNEHRDATAEFALVVGDFDDDTFVNNGFDVEKVLDDIVLGAICELAGLLCSAVCGKCDFD